MGQQVGAVHHWSFVSILFYFSPPLVLHFLLLGNEKALKAFKGFPLIWPFVVYLTNFQWEWVRPWLGAEGSLQRQYWQKVTGHGNPSENNKTKFKKKLKNGNLSHPRWPNILQRIRCCNRSLSNGLKYSRASVFSGRWDCHSSRAPRDHEVERTHVHIKTCYCYLISLNKLNRCGAGPHWDHDMNIFIWTMKLMPWSQLMLEIIPRMCSAVQKFKTICHLSKAHVLSSLLFGDFPGLVLI